MILGLDVSTTTTGFCLLNSENEILSLGYIPLAKYKDLCIKGQNVKLILSDLIKKYKIDFVYIEAPFERYSRGMSSAKTITRLASFNGIVQYICFDTLGINPCMLTVHESRRMCGIKTLSKKKAGKDVKEQVFEEVTKRIKYNWPTKTLKSGPRKGQTIIINESRDMADAWVIASAGFVKSQFL